MSWTCEYVADSSGKFCGNDIRFFTEWEALEAARSKRQRWTLVTDTRVVESPEPANYRWCNGQLEAL